MKPTSAVRDTQHELGQPLKELAYVSNYWGPLLFVCNNSNRVILIASGSIGIRKPCSSDQHIDIDN
ncbi:hypothetical protein DVZ93_15135 [Vibrio cholerae]|nr:hypothetical protein [Vibrio cholerae]